MQWVIHIWELDLARLLGDAPSPSSMPLSSQQSEIEQVSQQNKPEETIQVQEIDEFEWTMDADAWYQWGKTAEEQEQWEEAERCYRACLQLKEQKGDNEGAAAACHQLAMVAVQTERFAEAENWWKRALALIGPEQPANYEHASILNNLANHLLIDIKAGRASSTRLSEVRDYAEQSLTIKERLDPSSSRLWTTLDVLARTAELEGKPEEVRAYRRREREAFANVPEHRAQLENRHAALINVIVDIARGNEERRAELESLLPTLEGNGWHITSAVKRIWAGERDWHTLVEDVNTNSALLILLVLEIIDPPDDITIAHFSLHPSVRLAIEHGEMETLDQLIAALSPIEQRRTREALLFLLEQAEGGDYSEPEP